MDILEFMESKLDRARRTLAKFIAEYDRMEDSDRMGRSTAILDEVNSYLQIEENLLFPFIRKTGKHEDLIARSRETHSEINDIIEHTIHMHVDEAGGEFYDNLVRLSRALDNAHRVDQEAILPWAKVYLKEEDHEYIASHLKEQMVHESLPSSGMTIY